jgi:putative SOS response-associated peptidase YedK
MCGRYTLTASPEAIQQAFDLANVPPLTARYNIAPTQPVPIITSEQRDTLTIVQWGLIPSWSKDTSIASKLINARAETLDEKPSFKNAFKRRRCLIPADGFYEWKSGDKGEKKKPQFLTLGERDLFAFAGLWEVWNSPTGDPVYTCTIITAEPNDLVKSFHHRMAVILEKDQYAAWLDADTPAPVLKDLMRPYPPDNMHVYEVSTLVNNATVDAPEMIVPYAAPEQRSML